MNTHSQIINNSMPDLPEKLFYLTLNSTVDAVIIAQLNGQILWVNPAFEALTGYSYQEVIGKNTSLLKSGKQSECFYQNMWSTLNKAKVWQGELWN